MLGMSKASGSVEPSVRAAVRPRYWAQAKAENPLARFVPFSSLVSPNDVITRGGDYLRVWRLDGVPFECSDEHLIAERHEALCSLLRNLAGGQWAVWTHRLHRVVGDALQEPTDPGFARDLSIAYHAKLGERRMMSNELYMTLVYRPNASRMTRALQSTQRTRGNIADAQADALRVMEERSALVGRVLRGLVRSCSGHARNVVAPTPKLRSFSAILSMAAGERFRRQPVRCIAR
jgi:type IV secretion system protein VirB4